MLVRFGLVAAAVLLAAPPSSWASDATVAIKFGSDGCWHYVGKAYQYAGRFKAGTYLTMNTTGAISAATEADESQWEWRDPMLLGNNSVTQTSPGNVSYVPIDKSGKFTVTFAPTSSFGWKGQADLCVVTEPPE